MIVVRSSSGLTVADPRFRRKVTELAAEIERPDRVVTQDFYETRNRMLVSPDRRAALITVGLLRDAENDVKACHRGGQACERGRLRSLDHRSVDV